MEFLENLFTALNHEDSIAFLISMFIAFLIGFVTGWILYGGRARRFRKEAKRLQSELDNALTEQNLLREQLDLKEADLVKAEREAEEAIHLARTVENEKKQLSADLDTAHEAMEVLNAKIRSYTNTIEDLNNQILGLKARNNQLSQNLDQEAEATSQLAQMQSAYNASANRLAAIESKLEALLNENSALKTELESVKARTEALKTDTEKLKSNVVEKTTLPDPEP
ncbi:MAG: DUF1049 domain-containing protein, partial [Bacteroidetes bacterium]